MLHNLGKMGKNIKFPVHLLINSNIPQNSFYEETFKQVVASIQMLSAAPWPAVMVKPSIVVQFGITGTESSAPELERRMKKEGKLLRRQDFLLPMSMELTSFKDFYAFM